MSLTTEVSFPVSYNTVVTVSCLGGNELRGDNVITCNQNTDFVFSVRPKCNEMGQFSYLEAILSISGQLDKFGLVFEEL